MKKSIDVVLVHPDGTKTRRKREITAYELRVGKRSKRWVAVDWDLKGTEKVVIDYQTGVGIGKCSDYPYLPFVEGIEAGTDEEVAQNMFNTIISRVGVNRFLKKLNEFPAINTLPKSE